MISCVILEKKINIIKQELTADTLEFAFKDFFKSFVLALKPQYKHFVNTNVSVQEEHDDEFKLVLSLALPREIVEIAKIQG